MTELSRGAGRPAPALRSILALHLVALLAGIAIGDAWPVLPRPALGVSLIAMVLAGILRRRPAPATALLLACTLSAGASLPLRWTAPISASDIARAICDSRDCDAPARAAITGTIDAPPRPVLGGTRLLLRVEKVARSGRRTRATGHLRLHVSQETTDFRPGDRIRVVATLRAPRRYRNAGCADVPRILAREGIRKLAAVDSSRGIVLLRSRRDRAPGLDAVRARLSAFIRGVAPGQAGVLEALLLGEQGRIAPGVRDAYARAGVAHVLSVSGLHVAFVALLVAGMLGALLRRFPALASGGHGRGWALAGGMAAAWGYALLAGGQAPGLRAATMAGALAAAAIVRRRGDAVTALLLAAGWLALAEPARLFEVGTQLSFLSTAWLVLGWPAIAPRSELALDIPEGRRPLPARVARAAARWIRTSLAITLGVTLVTAPIQANAFGRISLVAPLANLIVVPLSGSAAVPLLLAAGVTLPLCEPLAALLLRVAAIAVALSTAAAEGLARLPWAVLGAPHLTPGESAACLALAFALPACRRSAGEGLPRAARGVALAATLFLLADVALARYPSRPPEGLRVTFLDVGQGDAALVETPEGERILVDAGPAFTLPQGARFDAGEAAVAPALAARRIGRIDVLAISHPDADHAGGVATILDRFDVRELWYPAGADRTPAMKAILRVARVREVTARGLALGDPPRIRGRTRIEILGPPPAALRRGGSGSRWNDASLVLRVSAPGLSVLLTGDVEAAGEGAILRSGHSPRADVLKVPHHGSRTSSTGAFLSAVSPRVAVISLGAWNRFGFPDPRLPDRLRRRGVRVFRTDRDGAVTVTAEAGLIRVHRAEEGP